MIKDLESLRMLLFRNIHDNGPSAKTRGVRQSQFVRVNGIGQTNVFVAAYNVITGVLDIHMHTSIATRGFQIGIQNKNSIVNQIAWLVDALVRLNQNRMLFGLKVQLSLIGKLNSSKALSS